jgi:putative flippase GtrA
LIGVFKSRQFWIFIVTGGFAAIINFLSRIVYNQWVDFSISIVIAYITGMITAFVLAKIFVFKESAQPLSKSIFYFILINVFAVLQTWAVSMSLVTYVFPWGGWKLHPEEIAHAIGIIVPVFSSYLGHKYITFR